MVRKRATISKVGLPFINFLKNRLAAMALCRVIDKNALFINIMIQVLPYYFYLDVFAYSNTRLEGFFQMNGMSLNDSPNLYPEIFASLFGLFTINNMGKLELISLTTNCYACINIVR